MPALLTPDSGLLFWMTVCFIVMFIILAKFGFPVITKMVDERKKYIDDSLVKAREANEKLSNIEAKSEDILKTAHEQQAKIIKDASFTGQMIISEAKKQAEKEGQKIIAQAKEQINVEREKAMRDIRSQIILLSTGIAQKILNKDLDEESKQSDYIDSLLGNIK